MCDQILPRGATSLIFGRFSTLWGGVKILAKTLVLERRRKQRCLPQNNSCEASTDTHQDPESYLPPATSLAAVQISTEGKRNLRLLRKGAWSENSFRLQLCGDKAAVILALARASPRG